MVILWRDARYGLRMLARHPGFSVVAILTLAFGIGANTAIFSLINALMLRSLPAVESPQRLVLVTDNGWAHLSYPLYERFRQDSQSYSGLFTATAVEKRQMVVSGSRADGVEPVWTQAVSGEFFSVLGVPVALGRPLTIQDDRPTNPQAVVVISHSLWRRRFGLDPGVIGRTITLSDVSFTIVGVAPRGFSGFVVGSRPDLWWPMQMIPQVNGPDWAENVSSEGWGSQWLLIMGRLKPGVSREQARAELDVGFKQMRSSQAERLGLSGEKRQDYLNHRIELESGGTGYSSLRPKFRQPLLLLMAIAGSVLLIACANLAGLLLARSAARGREFCLRAAIGANRLVLVRQMVTESLVLAGLGGILGLFLAQWGARLLAHYVRGYGESVFISLAPDLRVLLFAFAISACTGLLFGLIPAWRSSRLDLAAVQKSATGRLVGRESGKSWNKVLVISQIALCCFLLIGTALFVRTIRELTSLDTGFDRHNLLVFGLDLGKEYDDARRPSLYQEVVRRVRELPGVRSVSISSLQSLGGSEWGWGPTSVTVEGRSGGSVEGLAVRGTAVGPAYFKTMGIPLLRGRDFTPQDEPAVKSDQANRAPRPVIIDQTSAHRLFADEDPLGRLLLGSGRNTAWPPLQVIGVVGDVIHKNLRSGARISIYGLEGYDCQALKFLYVRTRGNPLALSSPIRQVVRELDTRVEVADLQTVDDLVRTQLRRERTMAELASFFSLFALALSCLGLYGMLSYDVVRRTREIGLRVALGAQTRDVLLLVMRQGMVLVLAGAVIGVSLAVAFTRIVSSFLYGVTPTDPPTFIVAVVVLSVVAVVSCYLPARQAVRIEPMAALRCE